MRIALDEQEVLALLRTAKSRSQRDFTMLLLTYRHGLRASEVAGIRLDDIENGHLTVARLKGSLRTCQPIVLHPGQPLLDEVRALREWLGCDRTTVATTSSHRGRVVACPAYRCSGCTSGMLPKLVCQSRSGTHTVSSTPSPRLSFGGRCQ